MSQPLWLQRWPQPVNPKLRLFCFPYAGGGASAYYHWVAPLAPEIAVCAIQLPAREGRLREAPARRLIPVVKAITDAIADCGDLPFAFFGHSMGSVLAFETARELRRRSLAQPVHVFASARQAPHLPIADSPIHALPDKGFLDECIRRYDGIPRAVLAEPALLAILLPGLRGDVELIETYQYVDDVPLPCPVTALYGRDDRSTAAVTMHRWSEHSSAGFRCVEFPGGHFFTQTSRAEVLALVRDALLH